MLHLGPDAPPSPDEPIFGLTKDEMEPIKKPRSDALG